MTQSSFGIEEVEFKEYRVPGGTGTFSLTGRQDTQLLVSVRSRVEGRTLLGQGSCPIANGTRSGSLGRDLLEVTATQLAGIELEARSKQTLVDGVRQITDTLAEELVTSPRLLAAIEAALLDLLARSRSIDVAELLGSTRDRLKLAEKRITVTDFERMFTEPAAHARTIRVQGVGSASALNRVVAHLESLGRSGEESLQVWVPARRRLSESDIAKLAARISKSDQNAFVLKALTLEDPLARPTVAGYKKLQGRVDRQLSGAGQLAIAINAGHLWGPELLAELSSGWIGALILDPTRIGGFLRGLDASRVAHQANEATRICLTLPVRQAPVTVAAAYNLARSLPRLDCLAAFPPRRDLAELARLSPRFSNRDARILAPQKGDGIGTYMPADRLAPYAVLPTVEARSKGRPRQESDNADEAPTLFEGKGPSVRELSDSLGAQIDVPALLERKPVGASYLIEELRPGQIAVLVDSEHWPERRLTTSGQHRYTTAQMVQLAEAAGAVAVVHSSPLEQGTIPLLRVPNTRRAMWDIALLAREQYRGTTIGITGTVGKSTTKDMLDSVLSSKHTVHCTHANRNSFDGVAMTLSGMFTEPEVTVVEASISGFVKRKKYSAEVLIQPDIAIITSVGVAHAKFAPTVEAVAQRKGAMIRAMRPGGTAIINTDTAESEVLIEMAKQVPDGKYLTFGESPEADFRLVDWTPNRDGAEISVTILGESLTYELEAPGYGAAVNSLVALGVGKMLGVELAEGVKALRDFAPAKHVTDIHTLPLRGGEATLIDDTKNAADLSMAAAFELTGKMARAEGGRAIAIVGGIVDLADVTAQTHASLAKPLRDAGIDIVITQGPDMEDLITALGPNLHLAHADSPARAATLAWKQLLPGDVVLAKGSWRNTGFRNVPRVLLKKAGK